MSHSQEFMPSLCSLCTRTPWTWLPSSLRAAKIYRNLYREGSSIVPSTPPGLVAQLHQHAGLQRYTVQRTHEASTSPSTGDDLQLADLVSSQTPPPLVHSRQSLGMRSSWTFNLCNCPQKISNLYEESRFLPQGEKHISEACFQPCWENLNASDVCYQTGSFRPQVQYCKLAICRRNCYYLNQKRKVKSIWCKLNANICSSMLNPAWQVNSV